MYIKKLSGVPLWICHILSRLTTSMKMASCRNLEFSISEFLDKPEAVRRLYKVQLMQGRQGAIIWRLPEFECGEFDIDFDGNVCVHEGVVHVNGFQTIIIHQDDFALCETVLVGNEPRFYVQRLCEPYIRPIPAENLDSTPTGAFHKMWKRCNTPIDTSFNGNQAFAINTPTMQSILRKKYSQFLRNVWDPNEYLDTIIVHRLGSIDVRLVQFASIQDK